MKNVKRILSWLLCLALVIGFIPAFSLAGNAAETITEITSVSQLTVGARIIISSPDGTKAMGAQSGTYRTQVAFNKTLTNNPVVFTVEQGSTASSYAFKDSDGKYLAYTGSKNQITTSATIGNTASWTVSIKDGIATIINVGNTARYMQHNSSDARFACYKNTLKDPKLWLVTSEGGGETTDPDTPVHECTEWAVSHEGGKHTETCVDADCGKVKDTDYVITTGKSDEGHWEECSCGKHKTTVVAHSTSQKYSAAGHWNECACGYKTEVITHTLNDGECACGYKLLPTYTKVDLSKDTISAGYYVIGGTSATALTAGGEYAFMTATTKDNKRLVGINLDQIDDTVYAEESTVWQFIASGNGFKVYNASADVYLQYKDASNELYVTDNEAEATVWTVVNTGKAWTLQEHTTADNRWIAANKFGATGSEYLGFATYKQTSTSMAHSLDFYAKDVTETPHDCVDTNPADHKCDTCGETVSECVDTTPKDHKCDTCGVTVGDPHEAAAGTHICAYCGEKVTDCVDTTPKDHKCDTCGVTVGDPHEAAEGKHTCAYCGEKVTDCEDVNPKDHKCDICGEAYGPAHADGDDADHTCDYCDGAVEGDVCVDGDDKDHNCDECGAPNISEHEYDNIYDAYCNICNEEREVPERVDALKNYATSLGGDIGFKMYFTLTEETLADANAYVSFTINGEEIERQYMTEAGEPDKDGEYAFMCGVAAAQMTDEVTVQLVYSNGTVGATGSYSVKDYVEQRLQSDKASAEEKALLKAMVNYGAYAQEFFGYNAGDLANDITGVELPDLNAVTAGQITQSNAQSGAATGIAIQGYSVLLEDETTFKFVFALEAGATIADYTFTYTDGTAAPVTLEAKKAADGIYCVYIEDIAAALLDQRYILTVTHTDSTSYSLETSVLCYVKSAINNANNTAAKIDMVKALYLYNQAANAYFNK